MESTALVSIRCLVYNHEPFLRKCLDGFVMQKTNFSFEAIVHDDASTDCSASIIREYAEKYPHIIKPIYEKRNRKSKNDGSLGRIMDDACQGKYIAICEGDDYWTDPCKLQKQVDFLESHLEYTMCCHRAFLFSEKEKKIIGENYCYMEDKTIDIKDIINRTGLFISTCSILYRKIIKDNYPLYCDQCVVGDYPLQIMCAMKGKTYFFNEAMSVYRVNNPNSWMGKQKWSAVSDNNLNRIRSMGNMFLGFASDYKEYKKVFENKCSHYINTSSPDASTSPNENKYYFNYFKDITFNYSLKWKLDKYCRTHPNKFSSFYLKHIAPRLFNYFYPKNYKYES